MDKWKAKERRFVYGWTPWIGYVLGGWFAALGVVLAFAVPEPLAKVPISGFNFGLAAFSFGRMARMGPYFEEDGLRVRRLYRTEFIPWNRVQRFVLRPRGPLNTMAHAELTDGSLVLIEGVGASPFRKRTLLEAEETIHEMNLALMRHRDRSR